MGKSRHRHQKALKTKGGNHHHNSSSAHQHQAAESSTNTADGRKNNNQNAGAQHNNNGSNKHNLKGKCFDDLTWEERKKKAENQERDDNRRKLIDRWGRCRSPHNTNSFLFKDVSPTIIGGEDAQNHDGNQETMLNEDIDELLARCQSSPQSSEKVSPPNVDGPSPFSGEKVLSPCPNNSLIPPTAKPIATRPTRSTNCNSTRICDQPSVIAVSNSTNSNAHEGSAQHNLTHDDVNIQNDNSSPNLNHDPRGGGSCEYMRMSVGVNTSPLLTPGEQQQKYGGHQDYRWKEEEARMGDPLESHPSSSSFDDGRVVARPNTSQAANTGCPTNRPFSPTTPLTSPPIETPAAHGEHPPMAASPECPFFSDSPIATTTAEDPYNTPLVQNSPLNFVSSQKPGQIVSPPLLSPSYRLGSNASPSVKAHIAAAAAAAAALEEEDAQKRRDKSISPPDTEDDWAITSLEAEIEERTKRIRTQQRELERLNALLEARRKESSRRKKRPREETKEDEGRIRGRRREEEVAGEEEENGRGSRGEEGDVEEEASKEPEKLPA